MADSFLRASGCEEFQNSSGLFFFFACRRVLFCLLELQVLELPHLFLLSWNRVQICILMFRRRNCNYPFYLKKIKINKKKKSVSVFYLSCCWLELQTELLSEQLPALIRGEILGLSILHACRQFSLTD